MELHVQEARADLFLASLRHLNAENLMHEAAVVFRTAKRERENDDDAVVPFDVDVTFIRLRTHVKPFRSRRPARCSRA